MLISCLGERCWWYTCCMRQFLLPLLAGCCLLLCSSIADAATTARFHGPFHSNKNPANNIHTPIETTRYQSATHCKRYHHPGVTKLVGWLAAQEPQDQFWGSYRCEKWGKRSASLHAENRAIDWHPHSQTAARHLINMLLATDKNGQTFALARRMGVQELIWQCSYWSSWQADFSRYSLCYHNGRYKQHVDPTEGHLNHIHIGLTKAGAAGTTSFWKWARHHASAG